jgi:hypothetical protein
MSGFFTIALGKLGCPFINLPEIMPMIKSAWFFYSNQLVELYLS